jgi:hypothetical protein
LAAARAQFFGNGPEGEPYARAPHLAQRFDKHNSVEI